MQLGVFYKLRLQDEVGRLSKNVQVVNVENVNAGG